MAINIRKTKGTTGKKAHRKRGKVTNKRTMTMKKKTMRRTIRRGAKTLKKSLSDILADLIPKATKSDVIPLEFKKLRQNNAFFDTLTIDQKADFFASRLNDAADHQNSEYLLFYIFFFSKYLNNPDSSEVMVETMKKVKQKYPRKLRKIRDGIEFIARTRTVGSMSTSINFELGLQELY